VRNVSLPCTSLVLLIRKDVLSFRKMVTFRWPEWTSLLHIPKYRQVSRRAYPASLLGPWSEEFRHYLCEEVYIFEIWARKITCSNDATQTAHNTLGSEKKKQRRNTIPFHCWCHLLEKNLGRLLQRKIPFLS